MDVKHTHDYIKLEQSINRLNFRLNSLKDRNKYLEDKDSKAREVKVNEGKSIKRIVESNVTKYFSNFQLKDKYEYIIQGNLGQFEKEIEIVRKQFYTLRVCVLTRDNIIRQLYTVLYHQELNFVDIKNSLLHAVRNGPGGG